MKKADNGEDLNVVIDTNRKKSILVAKFRVKKVAYMYLTIASMESFE